MAWTPIEPRSKARERADVTVGIGGRESNMRLVIIAKIAALPKGWKAGTRVQVSVGTGEHRGLLLLGSEGVCPFKLVALQKTTELVALRVPLPTGVTAAKRAGVAAPFKPNGKELLVTLPAFAVAPPPPVSGSLMSDQHKRR